MIVRALVEGNSIRASCRMTGAAKGTILKLLVDLGETCDAFLDRELRNLTCERIECDEIWAFCHAKQKNVPQKLRGKFGYGDVWTWTGSWRKGEGQLANRQAKVRFLRPHGSLCRSRRLRTPL